MEVKEKEILRRLEVFKAKKEGKRRRGVRKGGLAAIFGEKKEKRRRRKIKEKKGREGREKGGSDG